MTIKEKADKLLHETGLCQELKKYGEPHPIGSYRMDMMVYNDLDIDIQNDSMTLEKLHSLTLYILTTFRPTWYEAREEINDEAKRSGSTAFTPYSWMNSGTLIFGFLTGKPLPKPKLTATT